MQPIYADDHLLVYDKPSGLLSVPGRGPDKQDCLSERVRAQFADARVVHRLDMATSGLMLFARSAATQRTLSLHFAERQVRKRYLAVVDGLPVDPVPAPGGWGYIDLPIILDWPNRPLSMVDHVRGKPSLTYWRVLARDEETRTARLELEPVTGRSHQLRVHLRELGYPILGDALYAPPSIRLRAERLLLHAHALTLPHPANKETISFESRVPF